MPARSLCHPKQIEVRPPGRGILLVLDDTLQLPSQHVVPVPLLRIRSFVSQRRRSGWCWRDASCVGKRLDVAGCPLDDDLSAFERWRIGI